MEDLRLLAGCPPFHSDTLESNTTVEIFDIEREGGGGGGPRFFVFFVSFVAALEPLRDAAARRLSYGL